MNAQVPQEILDQIPHAEAVAKLNATGHALAAAVPHPGQIRRMKLSDPRGPLQFRVNFESRLTGIDLCAFRSDPHQPTLHAST